ncbi:MAG TPA: hydrogenase maturation protease [Candidatus Acidoferrales bacterium]|nr:hydrogenase maturation protease [Candidatus Acidoferrales bacterium]
MNEWEWQALEDKTTVESLDVQGVQVQRGERVRLRPRAGGDVFDLALAGKIATIESIEQDYEGQLHVCVVVDEDPGRDMGLMRQPGHRFFFAPSEIEALTNQVQEAAATETKRILIAGIGNIFMGDDAFGVAVANVLARRAFPHGVRVADFGIRGFDLAYALMEGYETTILVDAYPSEGQPGTLFVIEPDLQNLDSAEAQPSFVDPHGMNPVNVLRMAKNMGGDLKRILLLGCVPATLGPEEGTMGLSEPVTAAVDEAVQLIDSLVTRILTEEWPAKK